MGGGRKTILSASDRAGKISNPHIDEAHTDTVAEIQNTPSPYLSSSKYPMETFDNYQAAVILFKTGIRGTLRENLKHSLPDQSQRLAELA